MILRLISITIFLKKKELKKTVYDYASLVNDRKGRINIFRIFKNGDKKNLFNLFIYLWCFNILNYFKKKFL